MPSFRKVTKTLREARAQMIATPADNVYIEYQEDNQGRILLPAQSSGVISGSSASVLRGGTVGSGALKVGRAEPAGTNTVFDEDTTSTGAGTTTADLRPPAGHMYFVHFIAATHNDAAARDMLHGITDGTTTVSFVSSAAGASMAQTTVHQLYPYDSINDKVVGQAPLELTNENYYTLVSVALANTKVLSLYAHLTDVTII